MPRQGVSRLRPLRKLLFFSSACAHSQGGSGFDSIARSNFYQSCALSRLREAEEARVRFWGGSANGASVSGAVRLCRSFSVARMELEKLSGSNGTGVGSVGAVVEVEDAEEVAVSRTGDIAGDEQVLMESVEGQDMTSDFSSEGDLFSCVRSLSRL